MTVTLKLVQAYVTDKKGNPITDLTKAAFILYDIFIETQLQLSDEIGIFSYSLLKGLVVHEYLTSC